MNKKQKEVELAKLAEEKKVLDALKKQYEQAASDVAKKISLQTGKIDAMLKDWDDLDEQAKSILQSQIYQRKYQQSLQKQIGDIIDNMNANQYQTVEAYLKGCYETGFLGSMYDIHGQGIPIITPINQKAMVKAVTLDSKVSKKLYGTYVDELKKRIQSEVSRGVATNLQYSVIARNLNMQAGIGFNKAMRIARTEGHGVQVQAAVDVQHKAKEAGADIVKQWDSTLDGRTRESHRRVDGEIRELDEKFSNGMMFPSDSAGGAAEVINCRCALLQRARWALDDDELEALKERAAFFNLDKTANFEDFKQKYLKAAVEVEVVAIAPSAQKTIEVVVETKKKEYLTEKKLQTYIKDADDQLQKLDDEFMLITQMKYADVDSVADYIKQNHTTLGAYDIMKLKKLDETIKDIGIQKAEWVEKLDKKLVAKETKKLKKEKIALKEQLDDFEVKTYSGIWKDDVTTLDWEAKKGSVQAKKDYFEKKFLYASSTDEMKKWKDLIDQVDDFDKQGAAYFKIKNDIKKIDKDLDKIKKNGIIKSQNVDDRFSQDRKDAAHWFTDKNGGTKGADKVLRPVCGDVWQNASKPERDAIYEYTQSYHKFNEPLRGIEYGTNKFLGVGNVDLEEIGTKYGGYKRGQVKKQIDAMTSIIEKSTYEDDFWVQRGCGYGGMDKFFGISAADFNLPEAELAAKLLGTTPTEYGFMSTGVSKGKGFSHQPIIMNIYAPSGTKMMYAEPFSAFGNGSGYSWDGITQQSSFGSEAEMILQRGTTFRVTKVEKSGGKIYIDMEVIEQEKY